MVKNVAIAMHCNLRPAVTPVVLGFNHEADFADACSRNDQ